MADEINIDEMLEKIAHYYGLEPQAHQLVEEMAELTQVLNKLWRTTRSNKGSKVNPVATDISEIIYHIAEEIADVEICIEQVKILLGLEERVTQNRKRKVDRQVGRITRVEGEQWISQ